MKEQMPDRKIVNPLHIKRPDVLPPELTFSPGDKLSTRKAAGLWVNWLMQQTAFLWTGSGDLSGSIQVSNAEKIYGVINKQNPLGRGIRFGIAEQNMAMMSAGLSSDVLPGSIQPVAIFGTFAVFTNMMDNCIRLATINNQLNPNQKGFFITLATHDGPETAEDGPTHQGLYWMSLYQAIPGIKVYKPNDANETIEMLFGALEKGEPIIISLARPETTIWKREKDSAATLANNGAYVFKDYEKNKLPKKTLIVSGPIILENTVAGLPELEEKFNIKIVVATSPELFQEYKKNNPKEAEKIISEEEKVTAITIHNGWKGFLDTCVMPETVAKNAIGVEHYLKSGTVEEIYDLANLSTEKLVKKILET